MQVQKIRMTPYHPEGNAQCERFNQTLLGMIGSLNLSEKHRFQDWVSTLTHAYNYTHCDSTGFSLYYLMFGHVPHLLIDIEYGVTQPELINKSRQNYARKLRAYLNWAFKIEKDMNLKESERQKCYYHCKMHCQKLIIGDVVLVKEKGSSSNYKINDKWEMRPYTVLEHMTDNEGKQMPVFQLRKILKEGVPRQKTLHRNMLYPFWSVEETDNPLLVTCNILMDIYFSE